MPHLLIGIHSEIQNTALILFLLGLRVVYTTRGKNAIKDIIGSTDKCGIWMVKYYTDIFLKYREKEMLFSTC